MGPLLPMMLGALRATTVIVSLCSVSLLPGARGHGAMVHPRSRNSIDAFDVLAKKTPLPITFAACVNVSGGSCTNGQSAFWYSQVRLAPKNVLPRRTEKTEKI